MGTKVDWVAAMEIGSRAFALAYDRLRGRRKKGKAR